MDSPPALGFLALIGRVAAAALFCRMLSETVEIRGHIIDSLTLPKVLDAILQEGGNFKIIELKIGQQRADQSFARIEISVPAHEKLDAIALRLRELGAEVKKLSGAEAGPSRQKPTV